MYVNPEADVVTCKLSKRCLDLGIECLFIFIVKGKLLQPPSFSHVELWRLCRSVSHPPSLYPSISHSQQPWMLQIITLLFYCSLSVVTEFYTDLTCAENVLLSVITLEEKPGNKHFGVC